MTGEGEAGGQLVGWRKARDGSGGRSALATPSLPHSSPKVSAAQSRSAPPPLSNTPASTPAHFLDLLPVQLFFFHTHSHQSVRNTITLAAHTSYTNPLAPAHLLELLPVQFHVAILVIGLDGGLDGLPGRGVLPAWEALVHL